MYKYQIMVNVRNPYYEAPTRASDNIDDIKHKEYWINFKCIEDSIEKCLDKFFNKYEDLIKKYQISQDELCESMYLTKIDTEICPKWKKLFISN